jgi:hypothetical protein
MPTYSSCWPQLGLIPPTSVRKPSGCWATPHGSDPLAEWLPLIRHAGYQGWSKLKGLPLDCLWARIGAEVLLRAHEDLAANGHLEPLPNVAVLDWRVALHDRITPRDGDGDSLERALGTFGLSPHPRVLLLVEGETELDHVPRLLAEFGLTKPEQVRVQQCEGSSVNAHLIARYGITPRLGKKIGDLQLIDRTPTALVIAMDAENKFATPAMCAGERLKLQNAIREEVAFQGGEIGQEDLDYLVDVRVWGDDKYELANFTDDELVQRSLSLRPARATRGSRRQLGNKTCGLSFRRRGLCITTSRCRWAGCAFGKTSQNSPSSCGRL